MTRAPSALTPMKEATRPIPSRTVAANVPRQGRMKPSRVRAVSGQPIEAASSSSGRGCPAPPVSDGSVGTAAEAGSAG